MQLRIPLSQEIRRGLRDAVDIAGRERAVLVDLWQVRATVDASGAHMDQAANLIPGRELEDSRRPQDVDGSSRGGRREFQLRQEGCHGCCMNHHIGFPDQALPPISRTRQVPLDERHAVIHAPQELLVLAIRCRSVQHGHGMAVSSKALHDMYADKPEPPGHERVHHAAARPTHRGEVSTR